MGEFAGRGLLSHTRPLARESSSRHRTFQPGLCPWMPFGADVYAMAVHYETVEGGDESADKWAIMGAVRAMKAIVAIRKTIR